MDLVDSSFHWVSDIYKEVSQILKTMSLSKTLPVRVDFVSEVGSATSLKKKRGRPPSATLGPRKQLFAGLEFFLTVGGAENLSRAYEVVYDKVALKDTLERNGGKVVDHVGKESESNNIYVLSVRHARTVKYIYCLAKGIPCVSKDWIKKCIEANKLLDWKLFQLKSGYSLERDMVIERHTNKPLRGMKIYILGEELYAYWKPVLNAAQAIVLQPDQKTLTLPSEAEVLVTCETWPVDVFNAVKDIIPIPIVRPEWLVQTIVTGERADFFGHERYNVQTVEMDDE